MRAMAKYVAFVAGRFCRLLVIFKFNVSQDTIHFVTSHRIVFK